MTIKLYWWRGEGAQDETKQNFGDYLSPLIVEMLSGKRVEYADAKHADLLAIGSILPKERKAKGLFLKRRLHIWGSGTDRENRVYAGRHTYHAVRGAITASQIENLQQTPALGDPGLLVDRLWEGRKKPGKKYRLGIIPHYVDHADSRVQNLSKINKTKIINVFSPVHSVIEEILQCDFILSSSMHGLIMADAFGIPNRRTKFSSGVISDLKFDDYYSAFDLSSPPVITPESIIKDTFSHSLFNEPYARPGLEEVKSALEKSFSLL
tara:strand:- start:645 stop:1442 length:798 start_codon:yes stop_codon:yes gene_type:complete